MCEGLPRGVQGGGTVKSQLQSNSRLASAQSRQDWENLFEEALNPFPPAHQSNNHKPTKQFRLKKLYPPCCRQDKRGINKGTCQKKKRVSTAITWHGDNDKLGVTIRRQGGSRNPTALNYHPKMAQLERKGEDLLGGLIKTTVVHAGGSQQADYFLQWKLKFHQTVIGGRDMQYVSNIGVQNPSLKPTWCRKKGVRVAAKPPHHNQG